LLERNPNRQFLILAASEPSSLALPDTEQLIGILNRKSRLTSH
jgi:hypothetical protein